MLRANALRYTLSVRMRSVATVGRLRSSVKAPATTISVGYSRKTVT
jgi:hypothetical protein